MSDNAPPPPGQPSDESAPPPPPPPPPPPSYGQPAAQPYAQPPAPPYGQPPAQPYGQPSAPQYAQPYAQPYGYAPPADLPQATTALVLGLVALLGGLFCLLPILAGPFAWVIGHRARRTIRQSPGSYGGDGKATAGMVLGIIATVILALLFIGLVVIVIVIATDPTVWHSDGSNV